MSVQRKAIGLAIVAPVVLGVLLAGACKDATQIELVVETDIPCPELRGVAITVGPDPETVEARANTAVTTTTVTCDAAGPVNRIGSLVITPRGGDASSRGAVVVVGGVGQPAESCSAANNYSGCVVARRFFSFAENTNLSLVVRLSSACIGVACNAGSTCVEGVCRGSGVECGPDGCDAPDPTPVDAGPLPDIADALADGPRLDGSAIFDSGICVLRTKKLRCPNNSTTVCEEGLRCCVCPANNCGIAAPEDPAVYPAQCMGEGKCNGAADLGCFGTGDCPGIESCCFDPNLPIPASSCRAFCGAGGGSARLCVRDCECRIDERCAPRSDLPFVSSCVPK